MAKQPKGFGQPTQSQRKKSVTSKSSQKKSVKVIPLLLTPLADTELLEVKEARLKQIFDTVIPQVSLRSLQHYHQYLQSQLMSDLMLMSEEPFPWEDSYVFGQGNPQTHHAQRRQSPSYLDRFQLLQLSSTVDTVLGIKGEVQRLEDQKIFTLPLIQFKVNCDSSSGQTALADYRFWWWNYQPTYP